MRTYYFDSTKNLGWANKEFPSDAEAIEYGKRICAEIVYHESDTEDGTPFIIDWEDGSKKE